MFNEKTALYLYFYFCCGTSRDPREGLWMIEFSKIFSLFDTILEIPRDLLK